MRTIRYQTALIAAFALLSACARPPAIVAPEGFERSTSSVPTTVASNTATNTKVGREGTSTMAFSH